MEVKRIQGIEDPFHAANQRQLASKVHHAGYDIFAELSKSHLLKDGDSVLVAVIPKGAESNDYSHYVRIENKVQSSS